MLWPAKWTLRCTETAAPEVRCASSTIISIIEVGGGESTLVESIILMHAITNTCGKLRSANREDQRSRNEQQKGDDKSKKRVVRTRY
jgi:hypothetical protein